MTDPHDPDTQAFFDEFRRDVGSSVDVESGLTDLYRWRGRRPGRSARRPGRVGTAALAAAAAVAVLVAGAAWWPSPDSRGVDATAAGSTDDAPCTAVLFVYLDPGVDPEVTAATKYALAQLTGIERVDFIDSAATYEFFERSFADEPDVVASLDPSELPTSFRLELGPDWDPTQVEQIEALAGVYDAQQDDCGRRRDRQATVADFETTTTSMTPGAVPPASSTEAAYLPLDDYSLPGGSSPSWRLAQARELLVEQCMAAQGFDYELAPVGGPVPRQAGVTDDAYGLSEFSDAGRYGYRERVTLSYAGLDTTSTPLSQRFSPEYFTALYGGPSFFYISAQPPAGCSGEARRRIDAGYETPAEVLNTPGVHGELLGEPSDELRANFSDDGPVQLFSLYQAL